MLDELLREIVVLTVGKQAEPIADLLNTNKHVNEFLIAKKLGITINQTRNILYKISDFGLVSSERKKDKKKGWYTYFWKFEILKCLEFLKKLLVEHKEEIENQINSREKSIFYICTLCNLEHSGDEALLMDFTCDECGELFETKDNSKLVKDLKKSLEKIDEKMKIIDSEIEKEVSKLDKKKAVEFKKEEKEKDKKREEAKKKREERKKEKEKAKNKKEIPKTVSKKKAPVKEKKLTKKKKSDSKEKVAKTVSKKKVPVKEKKLTKKKKSNSKEKVAKKNSKKKK
jgi:transcription initiation factor TFIIE subunit alpha